MAESDEEDVESTPQHCYHCGRPTTAENLEEDWLCPHCGRYQNSVTCPTCHQVANKLMMDESAVPAPAKAKKA